VTREKTISDKSLNEDIQFPQRDKINNVRDNRSSLVGAVIPKLGQRMNDEVLQGDYP